MDIFRKYHNGCKSIYSENIVVEEKEIFKKYHNVSKIRYSENIVVDAKLHGLAGNFIGSP